MPDVAVGQVFIEALRDAGAGAFVRLGGVCAETVEFVSAVSPARTGPGEVVAQLSEFQAAGRFARAVAWRSEGEAPSLRVVAELPLDSFYARYFWDLTLDGDGKVAKIAQVGVAQTEPLPPTPIRLNEEISAALRIARDSRNPVIVAYVDSRGRPSQAPRGTVQMLGPTQLALWVHNPEGGLITAIRLHHHVSLHYWGGIGTAFGGALLFQGQAHVSIDDATRAAVYDNSPVSEQRSDPERRGCAVVVELEAVSGFMAGRRYNLSSEAR